MTDIIAFTPFLPEHLRRIAGELSGPMERYAARLGDPAVAAAITVPGLSWSGICDGRLVGCAGVQPVADWPGRATAWALIGPVPRRAWPSITRFVHKICDAAHRAGWHRIETTVLDGFDAGHRWAARCGFRCEGLMEAYGPDGADHWRYARIRR